jgi:prepilin-type N-terminal cleavage/methylation domain-containing protein
MARAGARREDGFTLLETLVALAILGMALSSSMLVFSDSLQRSRHAVMENDAANLAQGLIAQMDATVLSNNKPFEGVAEPYHWRIDVVPAGPGDIGEKSTIPASVVTVEVAWPESGRPHFLKVRSVRLGVGPAK